MKPLISILAFSFAFSLNAFGKAYFFTQSELVEKASAIAIVTIEEPEATSPASRSLDPFADTGTASDKKWAYSQQAKVHVEKVLKGEIPDTFVMYGKESFICAQCLLSKGRFLAFLGKDGDLLVGANWQLSLRPIRDGEVEWYVSEEQRFPMEFQKLNDVLAQIQAMLEKHSSPTNRRSKEQE
ncbi:MAG TPA: hypothetical protein PLA50_15120 [Bacteroidia bacterium]|nr:hypothetical protein [Bacteroidia bacterium]